MALIHDQPARCGAANHRQPLPVTASPPSAPGRLDMRARPGTFPATRLVPKRRYGLATPLIAQAVSIRRELAAASPDAFRPGLASSLTSLAMQLGDAGRAEDGLAAIEEAITIRWELAARWPDVYRQDLEQSVRVAGWLEDAEDISDAPP